MNSDMQAVIFQHSHDPLERVLVVLNRVICSIKDSHQSLKKNVSFCWELRQSRKEFEKYFKVILSTFKSLPEKKQVEMELDLYRLLKRVDSLAPTAIQELEDENRLFFSWFLIREIRKTLATFNNGQKQMEAFLYPDPTEKILSNPNLCQDIVNAWGDLADEE